MLLVPACVCLQRPAQEACNGRRFICTSVCIHESLPKCGLLDGLKGQGLDWTQGLVNYESSSAANKLFSAVEQMTNAVVF